MVVDDTIAENENTMSFVLVDDIGVGQDVERDSVVVKLAENNNSRLSHHFSDKLECPHCLAGFGRLV